MHDEQTPFQPSAQYDTPQDAPPTEAGDFVPVAPPEGWPTVIGVLSIIFGALGIISGVCNTGILLLGSFASGALPQDSGVDMDAQMQQSFPYPVPQSIQMIAEFGIAVLLLVGGVMLLKRKRSAAKALTSYAWLDLLANTYGAVVGYFVMKASLAAMQDNPDTQQAPSWVLGLMQQLGTGFVVLAWLFAAIWPVFLLLWFRRAKIQDSMSRWGG